MRGLCHEAGSGFTLPVKPLEPLAGGIAVTTKTVKTVRFTAQIQILNLTEITQTEPQ
uniref:Uncharacterized protein n=1 Tax=Arundo donax TaxID=35708 RepID=A0A0A9H8Y4_ARUDO